MTILKKWRLFPRSLRQLVVVAFCLVLLPLLGLAWQAYQSLDELSNQAAQISISTVQDARRSEEMSSLALEMERSYRQYCVLGNETLKNVWHKQYLRYEDYLARQKQSTPDPRYTDDIAGSLGQLSVLQCENGEPVAAMTTHLEAFARSNADLVQAIREANFRRGEELQNAIARKGQSFGWQSLLVFVLSTGLIILFTRMIIGPVKVIERMVNRLGEGRNLIHRLDNFNGPRELRSLALRIVWLSERLDWLESQRHEFLRHISHELKTPLASMREGTELLADEVAGPLTADQKEVVSILSESSRHLQVLIEQLLEYNRTLVDSPTEAKWVNLDTVVHEVVSAHSLPARSKEITTEVGLDETSVWAEPVLLTRVLDNLYSNAVHYGAESGKIRITSRKAGQHIQIDVANTGTPIPEEEQEMIFEPFYQGSLQRKGAVKGSGLGLSIARDCINRMGGELILVGSEGADVCFRIQLPFHTLLE
ncbi:sensor histidine kinase [Morganella morganii]|uniref:sensor histidine kinase n=1 Tax=Morganella morganii TaxID=582 RepID=UPI00046A9D67|nr:HAMP domain-containing sensor histidine kinase [Morganella morganii]